MCRVEEVHVMRTGENVWCTMCRGGERPCVLGWGGDSGPRGGAWVGLLVYCAFRARSHGQRRTLCTAFDWLIADQNQVKAKRSRQTEIYVPGHSAPKQICDV